MPTHPRKEGPRRGVPGVGKRIREARKRKGLTIRALAELTRVGAGSLTFWELANRDLFVGDFLKLTAALNVPPESLLLDALPLPPEVFAASFECPGCHMEAGVLLTAMSPPRRATPTPHERNAR
jgi:transcriptional regulator with XRE-family HTH domain